MKIGELARLTGTKAETVRYYEKIGILRAPGRTGGNYRDYGPDSQERLTFIRNARGLGFEIADIQSMLDLDELRDDESANVERTVTDHIRVTRRKIAQLVKLQSELEKLLRQSPAEALGQNQIMKSLADDEPANEGSRD